MFDFHFRIKEAHRSPLLSSSNVTANTTSNFQCSTPRSWNSSCSCSFVLFCGARGNSDMLKNNSTFRFGFFFSLFLFFHPSLSLGRDILRLRKEGVSWERERRKEERERGKSGGSVPSFSLSVGGIFIHISLCLLLSLLLSSSGCSEILFFHIC